MIDDERIERLLRARPTMDSAYEPALADLLDGDRVSTPVQGVLRWRYGNPGLARLVPLILLGAAILVAATAVLVGGTKPDRLVVVEPPTSFVAPEPVPVFPTYGVTAILEQFKASHWGSTPNALVDVAIQRDERLWTAISDENLGTTMGQGSWPGSTAVRIGATGHIFVAGAVLILVDQGRLDINTPVARYLPDWPDGNGITIRDLLDGSSGVAAFGEPIEDLASLVAAEPARAWSATDALRIARDKAPRFQAGARHAPVDTEDVLLMSIIEAATGMSLEEVMVPALMAADKRPPQAVLPDPSNAPNGVHVLTVAPGLWPATGSGPNTEVPDLPPGVVAVLGPSRSIAVPVSGLAMLTHDLHSDPLILSGSSRAMLNGTLEDGGLGGSAMCPCTGDAKDGVGLVGHTGPYTALAVYVPSKRMTIAIVANTPVSDDDLQGLLQEIHDLVWPAIS